MSRILIVEDEEAIAELEKDYLELNENEATTYPNLRLKTAETRDWPLHWQRILI